MAATSFVTGRRGFPNNATASRLRRCQAPVGGHRLAPRRRITISGVGVSGDNQKTRQLADFVFKIADKLRGPYRPPQYRRVMLPMTVLRRLDCVLEPTKDKVVAEYERLNAAGEAEGVIDHRLMAITGPKRTQPLWNTSRYTFRRLLDDPCKRR
jgi:hypothetical protein